MKKASYFLQWIFDVNTLAITRGTAKYHFLISSCTNAEVDKTPQEKHIKTDKLLLSINALPTIFPKAFAILLNTYRKVEKLSSPLDGEAFCICLHWRIPQWPVKRFLIPSLSFCWTFHARTVYTGRFREKGGPMLAWCRMTLWLQ